MRLILTNAPPDAAASIARTLVDARLVACVNLLPITSVFRWKGEVQTEVEVTLLCKVGADAVERCVTRLRELHPYELPEILVLPVEVEASLSAYVAWVRAETSE